MMFTKDPIELRRSQLLARAALICRGPGLVGVGFTLGAGVLVVSPAAGAVIRQGEAGEALWARAQACGEILWT